MLYKILIIIDVILAVGIIGLVLLQRGKGAETGAAFGGGASGTVFGAQGSASFLSRMTAVFATLWFATTLGLAYMAGQVQVEPDSVIQRAAQEQAAAAANDALPVVEDGSVVGDPALDQGAGSADDLPAMPAETDAGEPPVEAADAATDDAAADPEESGTGG